MVSMRCTFIGRKTALRGSKMKIKELVSHLEAIAPLALQESYDNSGLQIGNADSDISSALICVDCTEEVVQEAIDNKCGLIISHHPLIFGGLKSLTGANHVERIAIKALKNGIALYAIHTNLDNVINGVNGRFAKVLGLKPERVLRPAKGTLLKLGVHVPTNELHQVRKALFDAGAGVIGNYSNCSFTVSGKGSFLPLEGATPSDGVVGELKELEETRLELVLFKWKKRQVLAALQEAHSYEEVAFDLLELENDHPGIGSGLIGTLPEAISENDFLNLVKERLGTPMLRHSGKTGKMVRRVAICGGSGSFLLQDAVAAKADAFLTADLKYHQFQEPDGRLLMVDAGHYETEKATMALLQDILGEKFPKFALHLTKSVSNPIHYA